MFFDSHAHYDDGAFSNDRDFILEELRKKSIGLINVGSSIVSSKSSVNLAAKYDFIYAAVGVHPHDAAKMTNRNIDTLRELSSKDKVVAIGEIGLDYHYTKETKELQHKWFKIQLELAKELDLPVIIHDRESHLDCFNIVKESGIRKGVFHCYSGSYEFSKKILELGFYISLGGPITYKNALKTVDVAEKIPRDRFLIETDCPYLSPVPKRGERNSSLFIEYTAKKVAEIWNVDIEEVAAITKSNAESLFNIIVP